MRLHLAVPDLCLVLMADAGEHFATTGLPLSCPNDESLHVLRYLSECHQTNFEVQLTHADYLTLEICSHNHHRRERHIYPVLSWASEI